jgi:hypothetical protein
MRWTETVGHQMFDEHGKPTAPTITYIYRAAGERLGRVRDGLTSIVVERVRFKRARVN